ncbi:SOS response-associated peptidase family protein [Niveibacterium umoris]|uniref:Abasic site processing protein n=1 Tax=Niveibacterium umoris TaxID=1193620 RepID=A0A840BM74_9RHOO|nr:SOS response-associated peptidase family protein [Niveibacterium umoris]MBB4014651.1 putative SOS response-associated peptidase YedK [Niveibacterium umoris]
MCANYTPAKLEKLARIALSLAIREDSTDYREAFPGGVAPFLANILPHEWLPGMFGLVPHWGDPARLSRMTYNARSETVAEKPSFRNAWKQRQFGLIPVDCLYEPNYESGKAVRWRIERADGEPFALAGLWERRMNDEGPAHWSFSMLTVNADEHPFMRQFHKPGDEKRSVVVLDPDDYPGWLRARTEAEARSYLRLFDPDIMTASPAPLPPRKKPAA